MGSTLRCRQGVAAPAFVQSLLERYSSRPPLPARSQLWVPPITPTGGAVMRFVRTAAGVPVADHVVYSSFLPSLREVLHVLADQACELP